MDGHKRYARWLVSLVLLEALVLLSTALYLEPLAGDETRLGGFAENDFGWNLPQKVFPAKAAPLRDGYDQYSDILVVGDSFSFAGNHGVPNYPWQTFLAAKTGLSVATVSHYKKTEVRYDPDLLPRIVGSEAFQRTPPRVFIMEVVERQLNILPAVEGDCRSPGGPGPRLDLELRPSPGLAPTGQVIRKKNLPPMKEQVAYAVKYLSGLARWAGSGEPVVYRLGLTSGALFSNRRSGEMLVFQRNVHKKTWTSAMVAEMGCKLLNMQNLVQGNGKTLFVAMVVPDKLSVYSDYLRDRSLADLSVVGRLASNPALHLARLDLAMKSALAAGAVDLYLPNDTHWGYLGHQVAADALARYLAEFTGG